MRKIEKRAVICMALAILLAAGTECISHPVFC